ncbi:PIN domain-containing protein [Agromyces protaetiae]|uniref:Ribonuclease VapC n=1 Tax=Agromyces protaetiae TaxID=2509455 RepID=A0A4P6FF12_9MICO|nr:type II toxin-antitoxin system VapC family toxin [Agromyces protaetiae]QAY73633.1 PIN domain-containing protein [Agromyces protaetiae]
MRLIYLDTSAAMKLLVSEVETAALLETITTATDGTIVASWLLHSELHCASGRRGGRILPAAIEEVLDTVQLVDLTRGDLIAASAYAPLRTNDAIHLAVAIRLGAGEIITYDRELAAAAAGFGIKVVAPGTDGAGASDS